MNNSVILLGIKHSGKSTQGRLLAEKVNCPFVDIDDVITEVSGLSPRDLYAQQGVGMFMRAEEEACKRVASENSQKRLVIATGGGICDNAPALQVLRPLGSFVFLNVAEHIAINRILNKARQNADDTWTNLPAYIAREHPQNKEDIINIFHEFYVKRGGVYSRIADIKIDIADKTKDENAHMIAKALGV